MTKTGLPCPAPPEWEFDWTGLSDTYPWIEGMRGCAQEPLYHAEGDVWTHVGMVCEALVALPEFRLLDESDREIVFAAALLHDVAKPLCTRIEEGRLTSRGHSFKGVTVSRRILWELGADFAAREEVCALVRYHQSPFYLLGRPDAQRFVFLMSQTCRCDLLTLLAKADALGRYCQGQEELLLQVELCREFCREQGCLAGPKQFPSTLSRFLFFRTENRDPEYLAHDESRFAVTLMSGLPGAGKDTWIAGHIPDVPQVSLDAIRERLDVGHGGRQGTVVQEARERARELLRLKQSFVWNATNLSREIRNQLVELFFAYGARVRIVYVEAEPERQARQNKERHAAVASAALERMMDRWEVPEPTEAREVEYWCGDTQILDWPLRSFKDSHPEGFP